MRYYGTTAIPPEQAPTARPQRPQQRQIEAVETESKANRSRSTSCCMPLLGHDAEIVGVRHEVSDNVLLRYFGAAAYVKLLGSARQWAMERL